ncbi:MAG: sulfite exporter TauE/SafE family protein [Saprospiraceae bacterium]
MGIVGSLVLMFFLIAIVYSSVGFGGGSSYIAILLLMNVGYGEVRFIALVCNILVVTLATYNFYKAGMYNLKEVLPLVVFSVPLAFLGGMIDVDENLYKTIAAILLLLAAISMIVSKKGAMDKNILKTSTLTMSIVGGGIGFLSGFIGIGGGVFLAPFLYLIGWDNVKKISAFASLFIFVNSISGLIGQLANNPIINYTYLVVLGGSVIIGGIIGNRLNLHLLPAKRIKLITAILIGFVGLRILFFD